MNNIESILISIKKLLGIDEKDENFDMDIIIHINSVFSILTQLGVGPKNGFSIVDEDAVWTDFVPENKVEMIKSYMHLKVKLIFDPPAATAVIESIKEMIKELEWRINIAVDPEAEEENQNG